MQNQPVHKASGTFSKQSLRKLKAPSRSVLCFRDAAHAGLSLPRGAENFPTRQGVPSRKPGRPARPHGPVTVYTGVPPYHRIAPALTDTKPGMETSGGGGGLETEINREDGRNRPRGRPRGSAEVGPGAAASRRGPARSRPRGRGPGSRCQGRASVRGPGRSGRGDRGGGEPGLGAPR